MFIGISYVGVVGGSSYVEVSGACYDYVRDYVRCFRFAVRRFFFVEDR